MWMEIKNHMQTIFDEHVPSKFSTTRFNQPWITRKIKKLSKRNNKAMSKAKTTKSARDWDIYKRLKRELQKECKKAYENYIMNTICGDYDQNPKKLYGLISDPKYQSEILNDQFVSVFPKEDMSSIPSKGTSPYPDLPHITITGNGDTKCLRQLNHHKASGPESIPTRLLKEIAYQISPALTLLYQQIGSQLSLSHSLRKEIEARHSTTIQYRSHP